MKVRDTDERGCLTLNVWSPSADRSLPVLVWFHGGSFVIGASSQAVYDGAYLASDQDVVVVSANYRLGAFGFLDARPFGGVTNCGLRDAICALQWVHDNIASFGGDPDRVVAFGESAGGGLVLHALASSATRGLVAGAIVQSGATFATLDEERAATVVDALVKEAGVDDAGALVDLSADALVTAQSAAMVSLLGTVGMMPFHPMVDHDVVPAPPAESFARGAAAGVALIAGTTADEMRLFVDTSARPAPREKVIRRASRYLGVEAATATRIVEDYERVVGDDTNEIWPRSSATTRCSARVVPSSRRTHPMVPPTRTASPGTARKWVRATASTSRSRSEILSTAGRRSSVSTTTAARSRTRCGPRGRRSPRTGSPGWASYPSARVLGRDVHDVDRHPLFARLPAL